MRLENKKRIGTHLGLLLVLVIMSYTAFEMKDFVQGPDISIEFPENGATVRESLIAVRGKAANISEIQMNGGKLFTDPEGHFKKDILLSPGYNVIEVRAVDKFGRSVARTLEVVHYAPQPVAAKHGTAN